MKKKGQTTGSPGYQAPAVHKAFRLMRAVAESRGRIGLTDLALKLGYSKSTTHGLVHALLREGALSHGPNGRDLFIGPAVADLTFSSWNYLLITELAQPAIDTIRDRTRQTVFLGVLIHHRVLIMATAEADEPLKISASPGTTLPLFAGAVGKVFLAGREPETVKALIREKKLPRNTRRSIVTETEYLDELARVRAQGYAIDDEEYLTGVRAVAVALENSIGPPMAVWVVGLTSTMGTEKMREVIDVTTETVDKLRIRLDSRYRF